MLEHGGRLRAAAQRYGIPLSDWLDLSTGIAPYHPPLPSISSYAWTRLPEPDDGLEAAARQYYDARAVLPVAGSQSAIQALPRLRGLARVGIVSPCYAEHAEAWRRVGIGSSNSAKPACRVRWSSSTCWWWSTRTIPPAS